MSALPTIGVSPPHSTPRLKHHLSRVFSGGTPETGNSAFWSNDDSGVAWVAIGDMSGRDIVEFTEKRITEDGRHSRGLYLLPKGTLIYSMYATLGHVAELAIPATINQALLGFEFKPGANKQWVKWNLRYLQPRVVEDASSSTQDNLNAEKVRNLRIPLPPLPQQCAIADYLDRETARLDALVAAKERVLRLLAEKHRAFITRAVTRGLDPHAPLRDSGIPWLGEMPTHWSVKRVKYIFTLVGDPAPDDNNFELLSLYTDIGVRPRKDLVARGNISTTTDGYWMVRRGDLVVNKLLAWMGAFGVSAYDGVTSPAYDILRPGTEIESTYYHHLFRCGICLPEIKRRSYGIMDMRLRLYFDRLGDMAVPVPPKDEQAKIVASISAITARLDRLQSATERTIDLLKERRAALIAAAVTGQLVVA